MSLFKSVWRLASKSVIGVAHVGARIATAGVMVGGKVVKYAAKGTSCVLDAVGADRLANVSDNVGEAVDHAAQTASDAATAAVDMTVGTVLAAGSFIVGRDDVADDLGNDIRETIDSCGDNFRSTIDLTVKAKDNFVGKAQFDEAHCDYLKLVDENTRNVAEIKTARRDLTAKINKRLSSINAHKVTSKALFDRFEATSRKIAQWIVARYDASDVFRCEPVRDSPMKSAGEVFADVDFENDPIWNHIKGAFSAGLLTVAQVEDAKVKIYGCRRTATTAWKQDREVNKKYAKLLESLDFVDEAFGVFVPLYEKLQDELEYALSSVGQIMMQRDMYYFADANVKVNPYFLPKRHLNVLMACDKLTRILCEMSKRHYVAAEGNVPVAIEDDRDEVERLMRDDFRHVKTMLAA